MNEDGNYITINGERYRTSVEPLMKYWFDILPTNLSVALALTQSCSSPPGYFCGYFADWIVKDGKLFLSEFKGGSIMQSNGFGSFEQIFPDKALPLFADWFTGTIHINNQRTIYSDRVYILVEYLTMDTEFMDGILGKITSDTKAIHWKADERPLIK